MLIIFSGDDRSFDAHHRKDQTPKVGPSQNLSKVVRYVSMKSLSTRGFLTWEALLGLGIFALIALPLTGFLARSTLSLRSSEKLAQAPRIAEATFDEFQASPQELKNGALDPIELGGKKFDRTVKVKEIEAGVVFQVILEIRDQSQPDIVYRYQTRMAKL